MQVSKKQWKIAGAAFLGLVAVAIASQFYFKNAQVPSFPINAADTHTSWNFTGAYTGNDTLITGAKADRAKLTDLLGKGQYDDYDIYIGIGNDDNLMGDGKGAYENYNRAVAIHSDKGLAFANLGHLFDELGAYRTAADAYQNATAAEPGQIEFHIDRLKFLTRQFPNDQAAILSAVTDSSTQFGDNSSILAIEADWLTGQKRYADAISAWERARTLSPGKDTSAMTAEIERLKAKL
jgi:tetratricopeptide (TPR) repeat protein